METVEGVIFSFQAIKLASRTLGTSVNTHAYIGIFPTHEALHSSLLGHRPVDLRRGEQMIFYSSSRKRYTSLAFIGFLD